MRFKTLTGLFAFLFVGGTAIAQTSTTTYESAPTDNASRGIRISIVKPVLKMDVKQHSEVVAPFRDDQNLDQAIGVAVGWASLPIQRLGGIVNAAYFRLSDTDNSLGLARIDASLAYAPVEKIYIKAGANVTKFAGNSGLNDIDPGLGFQAGAGFQFTHAFGADVSYMFMSQSVNSGGVDADFQQSGPEFALTGTF